MSIACKVLKVRYVHGGGVEESGAGVARVPS